MIRIGVFTDAHYALGKQYGTRYCDRSLRKLEACLDDFAGREVSFVVNVGDIIDGAHDAPVDEANYARILEPLGRIGLPVHHVLGNHDLESLTKARVCGILGIPHPRTWYSFEHEGTRIVILDANFRADGAPYDSGNYEWTDALIPPEQLDWLSGELHRSPGRRTIVFVHQNLDERFVDGEPDPHLVSNAADVRSILEGAGHEIVVIQGHYHPGLLRRSGNVTYVTMRAMCEGDSVEDNAYAVATVTDDGVRIEGFGRQESYQLV